MATQKICLNKLEDHFFHLQKDMVLKEQGQRQSLLQKPQVVNGIVVGMAVVFGLIGLVAWLRRKK